MFDIIKLVLPILLESAAWELFFNSLYYVSSNLLGYSYRSNGNFWNNFNEITNYEGTSVADTFDYELDMTFTPTLGVDSAVPHNSIINASQISSFLRLEGSDNADVLSSNMMHYKTGTSAFLLKSILNRVGFDFELAYLYQGPFSSEYGFYDFTITKGIVLVSNVVGRVYHYTSNLELRPGLDFLVVGGKEIAIEGVNKIHITLADTGGVGVTVDSTEITVDSTLITVDSAALSLGIYAIKRYANYTPIHSYPLRSILNVILVNGEEERARKLTSRLTPLRCDLVLSVIDVSMVSPYFNVFDQDSFTMDLTPQVLILANQSTFPINKTPLVEAVIPLPSTVGSYIDVLIVSKYGDHVDIDTTLLDSRITVTPLSFTSTFQVVRLQLNADALSLTPIVSSLTATLKNALGVALDGPETLNVRIQATPVVTVTVEPVDGDLPTIYDFEHDY